MKDLQIPKKDVEGIIRLALDEDIGAGDITSLAVFDEKHRSRARIVAKENGVFCGGDMIAHVYGMIDPLVSVTVLIPEGGDIRSSDVAAEIEGPTIAVLSGERTALNFLQRMSGIATRTRRIVNAVSGSGIKILDTRKTCPGLRFLDKYSVAAGSGTNHRMGLYDMILVKENHISAAGGISRAVDLVRSRYGRKYKVEVEASTPDEADEAAACGADIIMLDNMDDGAIEKSIGLIGGRSKIEVSGNIDEDRMRTIALKKVDYVSIGALTHSVKAFDLSMLVSHEY